MRRAAPIAGRPVVTYTDPWARHSAQPAETVENPHPATPSGPLPFPNEGEG